MKKILILSLAVISLGTANAQSTWSLGIGASSLNNQTRLTGGMTDANARFHSNNHGAGGLGFVARKSLCEHWSFQTGLGFSSIGFDFAIAQNYSLLNKDGQYTGISTSVSTVNIPASIVYNTKLNCRNWRWFIGGGISTLFVSQGGSNSEEITTPDVTTTENLKQDFQSKGTTAINFHLIGGIEKVFKNNSILSFGAIFNGGTSNLATTNVSYDLDGKSYYHTFTNRGNYCGVYCAYYFRPLGSKKAK